MSSDLKSSSNCLCLNNSSNKGVSTNSSTLNKFSSKFFKIREIALTYNLPKTLSAKLRARDIAVSAVGQNMLLWAKDFKYSDPDGGIDNFSDPSQRYIGFNVKIDF